MCACVCHTKITLWHRVEREGERERESERERDTHREKARERKRERERERERDARTHTRTHVLRLSIRRTQGHTCRLPSPRIAKQHAGAPWIQTERVRAHASLCGEPAPCVHLHFMVCVFIRVRL